MSTMVTNTTTFTSQVECQTYVTDNKTKIRSDIVVLYPLHTKTDIMCVDENTLDSMMIEFYGKSKNKNI